MDYYNEIKRELIDNEINKRLKDYSKNRYELEKYYNVGKIIVEAQGGEERAKYGDSLIKNFSEKLTSELGKGYSERNLKNMRKFFLFKKGQPLAAESISWSHYTILLSIKDLNKINYYISIIKKYNLSKRQLLERIKSQEYERLPDNTKDNILKKKESSLIDYVKDPIIIKNNDNYEIITEKILKKLILEDIESFMKELGNSFSFIGSEYKIKVGDSFNYIDLLLFNIEFNCYVVVELKVTELKKEHAGQVLFYMNYIDKNLRRVYQDKTIGIIVCRKNNKYVIEYSSDKRVIARNYLLV